jgi:hypothetical protein
MNPQKEQELVKRYPHIFKDHGGDPMATCMAGGLCVGDGWFTIIDVLCMMLTRALRGEQHKLGQLKEKKGLPLYDGSKDIVDDESIARQQEIINNLIEMMPIAAQVKEKFGGLRFYTNGASPEQQAMIDLTEELSYRTCEDCGDTNHAMTYGVGWNRTLCPAHANAQYGAERATEFRNFANLAGWGGQ